MRKRERGLVRERISEAIESLIRCVYIEFGPVYTQRLLDDILDELERGR